MPAVRRVLTDNQGGSALELALVLPFYLLIVFSILSIAFLLWTEHSIQSAVQQAARCAAVNTINCGSSSAVQNAAIGWTNGVLTSSDTSDVTVDLSATCSTGEPGKSVAIQYTVTLLVISTTVAAEACYPSLSAS